MSWLYLPERGVACLQPNGCLGGELSATSRIVPTVSKCSRQESEMGCSTVPQSGTTHEPLTGDLGVDAWTSSLRASRASHGLQAGKGRGSLTTATSGLIPFALLEKSGLHGFSWKTLQGCFNFLTSGSSHHTFNKLSATWPGWGTWDDGAAYPLPLLDSSTNGDGCGLLPTPLARDGKSFYVTTMETALRVMRRTGSSGRQLHWMQYGIVFHDLKKGWANPRFSESMMGWPIGWTDLKPLEKGRFRQWLQQFGR